MVLKPHKQLSSKKQSPISKSDTNNSNLVPKLSLTKLDQLNYEADNPSSVDRNYFHVFHIVDKNWMHELRRCIDKKLKMKPQIINETFIKTNFYEFNVQNFTETTSFVLKNDLQLWADFEIFTKSAWEYILKFYEGHAIRVRLGTDGKHYFETMRFLSFNVIVRKMNGEHKSHLIQMKETNNPKEVMELIRGKFELGDSQLSLIIVDTRLPLNKIYYNLSNGTLNGRSINVDSVFPFKMLQDFEILMIYVPDSLSLTPPECNITGFCSRCRELSQLVYSCSCEIISYCSIDCKCEDFINHRNRCKEYSDFKNDVKKDLARIKDVKFNNGEIGIKNIGNSCYLNSLFQILKTIPIIRTELIQTPIDTFADSPFLFSFYHIMYKLHYYDQANLKPWPFKLFLGLSAKQFLNSAQNDASECLDFILNELDSFTDSRVKTISSAFKGTTVSRFHCKDCQNIETRSVQEPFFMFPISLIAEPPSKEFNVSFSDDQFDEFNLSQHLISLSEKEFTLEKLVEKSLDVKSKGNYIVTVMNKADELVKISNDSEFQNFIYENTLNSNQAFLVNVQHVKHQTNTFIYAVFRDYFLISEKYPQYSRFCRPRYIQLSEDETIDGVSVALSTIHLKMFDLMKGIIFSVFPELKKLYKEVSNVRFSRAKEVFYLALFRLKFNETEVVVSETERPSQEQLQERELFQKMVKEIQEAISQIKDFKNEKLYSINVAHKQSEVCQICNRSDMSSCVLDYSTTKHLKFVATKISHVKINIDFKKGTKLGQSFHKLTDKENLKSLNPNRGIQKQCYYLKTALDSVFAWEKIERKCEGCGSNNSSMQTSIKEFPAIMILHFKRFKQIYDKFGNQKTVKVDDFVSYDFQINILGEKYDLIGVVNHIGNLNDGHYTCCAFESTNNVWFEYNDTEFEKVTAIEDIRRQTNYILFYSRSPKLESCNL